MPPMQLRLYDTTLRDGTQREGLSLSVDDKVKIARTLDGLGVHYIEGGWPGSNPKDAEFFRRIRAVPLANARVAAFGSTRRAGIRCEDDASLRALVDAETPVATLVGKSSTLHVERILETSRVENLRMISDSVAFLKRLGREVIYDAEHFFDGYRLDRAYALETLAAAAEAGADWLVLCDTNGGELPDAVAERVHEVRGRLSRCPSASIRTTTRGSAWRTGSLPCARAAPRRRARSTATASGAATSISSRSWQPSSSSSAMRSFRPRRSAGSRRCPSTSPPSPTSIPTRTRRTSAGARSPTRAASTWLPSPSWPRATSTWIRPPSGTRCGWW